MFYLIKILITQLNIVEMLPEILHLFFKTQIVVNVLDPYNDPFPFSCNSREIRVFC